MRGAGFIEGEPSQVSETGRQGTGLPPWCISVKKVSDDIIPKTRKQRLCPLFEPVNLNYRPARSNRSVHDFLPGENCIAAARRYGRNSLTQ
jgi:hypothetical protein